MDSDDEIADAERAAALLRQLPPDARVFVADNPDLAWSTESQFLRLIEYELRYVLYVLCRGKGQRPRPIETPSERAEHAKAADRAESVRDEVDEALKSILPWLRDQSDETTEEEVG